MQFKYIIGQQNLKKQLVKTVKENRVSHAQLFLGPDGSGSLALAVAYAQYICCEQPLENDSCGECAACRKYQKLVHPDLHFSFPFFSSKDVKTCLDVMPEWREAFINNPYLDMDEWRSQLEAENKQANINIAECHQIIQKLSLKTFEAKYKVLIMWLPEYLEKEGNTLLKLIEEPPENTLFVLVAQSQEQILQTILSRTQIVKIPALIDHDIIDYLVTDEERSSAEATQIAILSEGSLQKAKRFLNQQETPTDHFSNFSNWLRWCFQNKVLQAATFTEDMAKAGRENQKNFIKYGLHLIRACVLNLSGAETLIHLPDRERKFVQDFAKVLTLAKAEAINNELEKAHYHIERNANPRILFLDVSLQFVKFLKFNSLPQGTQHIVL